MRVCEYKGTGITWARVCFPQSGIWIADVRFEKKITVPSYLTFTLHDLSLTGTVLASASGDYLDTTTAKIFGGKGGWKTKLPPNQFRGGALPGFLKTQTLLDDLQRQTGETISQQTGVLRTEIQYTDFIRASAPAFRVLNNVIETCAAMDPGPAWWTDNAGITQVGYRTVQDAKKGSYDVMSFDPSLGLLDLACYELSQVKIGSRIQTPDKQSLTIRELQINIQSDKTRIMAWI